MIDYLKANVFGKSESPQKRIARARRLGMKVSAAKEKKAEESEDMESQMIPVGTELFFDGFYALQNDRPQSMGESLLPIPSAAINIYCMANELVGDVRLLFVEVVRAMDMAYLEYHDKGRGRGKKRDADSVRESGKLSSKRPKGGRGYISAGSR